MARKQKPSGPGGVDDGDDDDDPVSEDKELPKIDPPAPTVEPWPDSTPVPMKPVVKADAESTSPAAPIDVQPPDVPPPQPTRVASGDVESPAHMPGPREIPGGAPTDPAPAPGAVPPGDSRSLRRGTDFALIYRVGTFVISRSGTVGVRGQWRVVEYPTLPAASHAYAQEASRFVTEGFTDYRA
jgi:hypothetical protein